MPRVSTTAACHSERILVRGQPQSLGSSTFCTATPWLPRYRQPLAPPKPLSTTITLVVPVWRILFAHIFHGSPVPIIHAPAVATLDTASLQFTFLSA